jgi:hypothetical protein
LVGGEWALKLAERSCTKLRHIDAAQLCAILVAALQDTQESLVCGARERRRPDLCQNSVMRLVVVTLVEPLKFVVNACLPTGPFRRQHYIS